MPTISLWGKAGTLVIGADDNDFIFNNGVSMIAKTDGDWMASWIEQHIGKTKQSFVVFEWAGKTFAVNIFCFC